MIFTGFGLLSKSKPVKYLLVASKLSGLGYGT
jgi:hypothetical protein